MKLRILPLLVLFVLSVGSLRAQPKQGDAYIGGGIGVSGSHTTSGDFRFNAFRSSISPRVGYFFKDNLQLGLTTILRYEQDQMVRPSQDWNRLFLASVGPSGIFYLSKGKVQPFVGGEALVSWNYGEGLSDGEPFQGQNWGISFSMMGGIAYWFADHVAMQAYLEFNQTAIEWGTQGGAIPVTGLEPIAFHFGASYIWSRKVGRSRK